MLHKLVRNTFKFQLSDSLDHALSQGFAPVAYPRAGAKGSPSNFSI